MSFNSFKFLLVFPLIVGVYWLIPTRYNQWRKVFLIVVSYLLYMNWEPAYALILFGVTLVTYWGGILLDKCDITNKRKTWIWLLVTLGFLPLLFFKYYNFLSTSLSDGLSIVGLRFRLPGLNWAIPVGISFFSFQAIGYMLDVYHGRIKAESSFVDYVLFVSFFPQIASGPISKADELLPQIKEARVFNNRQAVSGLRYLLWGMFLKVVLADRVGIYVDSVFSAYYKFSGWGCALASSLYSVQIYADFAGYSLMAVGVAKLLGFNLIYNFRRPYFSISVSEFWKRWHISLTRWLTQQVYIPLGGSRCGKVRSYINILITFLVSGIWHGANWTFIIWGFLHGTFQIFEKAIGWNKIESNGVIKAFRILLTFTVVTIAWIFFRSSSLGESWGFLTHLLSTDGRLIADMPTMLYIGMAFFPFLLFEVGKEYFPRLLGRVWSNRIIRWAAYMTIIAMIVLNGVHDGSSFIYVSF